MGFASNVHFTSLIRDPKLVPLFERLQEEKKKIFLITNSPFETVDAGMTCVYAIGEPKEEGAGNSFVVRPWPGSP